MSKILVSVICFSFNHERFIGETLRGIISQRTEFAVEVIVHDDCSSDRTPAIIKEYAEQHPDVVRPILRNRRHFGKYGDTNLTELLPFLSGRYVAICDGDDLWTSVEKLQRQVELLEARPEHSMCIHAVLVEDWMDGSRRVLRHSGRDSFDIGELIDGGGGGGQFFATSSVMFRADVFAKIPDFYVDAPVGDTSLALVCGLAGRIAYIDEVMGVYKFGVGGSWTANVWGNRDRRLQTVLALIRMYDGFNAESGRRYRRSVERQVGELVYAYLSTYGTEHGMSKQQLHFLRRRLSPLQRLRLSARFRFPRLFQFTKGILGAAGNGKAGTERKDS